MAVAPWSLRLLASEAATERDSQTAEKSAAAQPSVARVQSSLYVDEFE